MTRRLLYCILCFFPCVYTYSQQHFNFTIIDSANTNSKLTISESYFQGNFGMNVDSGTVICKNNRYQFSGTLEHPTAVRIFFSGDKKYKKFNQFFFIEPGNQEVVLKNGENGLYIAKRPTSKIEKEYQSFLRYINSDNIDTILDSKLLIKYIQENPASYIGLFKLIDQSFLTGFSPDFKIAKSLFTDKIIKTKEFKYYENRYLKQLNLPILEVTNEEKNKIKIDLKDKDGRYTLVVIWFNDCLPCIHEMKQLVLLNQNQEFSKKVRILHISVDDLKFIQENQATLKKHGVTWQNYWDVEGMELKKYIVLDRYPTTLLLDDSANVVASIIDIERIFEYMTPQ